MRSSSLQWNSTLPVALNKRANIMVRGWVFGVLQYIYQDGDIARLPRMTKMEMYFWWGVDICSLQVLPVCLSVLRS